MSRFSNILKPHAERIEKDAADLIFALRQVVRDLVYIDGWLENGQIIELPEFPQVKIVTNGRKLYLRRTGNGWDAATVEVAGTAVERLTTPEQVLLVHEHRAAIRHALKQLTQMRDAKRAAVSAYHAQRRKAKAQEDRYERQSRLNQIKAGLAK